MRTIDVSLHTEVDGHHVAVRADRFTVETPPIEHLAFYVGLGVLAAAEVIEWPLALLLTASHFMAGLKHRPGLSAFGEALSEA